MHGELLHFHLPVIQTNHLTLRHILARLYGCTIFNVSLYVVCFFHFCDLVWSVLKFLGFSRFPCLVLFIWGQLIKYENSRCHLPCKEMNSWNWHTHTQNKKDIQCSGFFLFHFCRFLQTISTHSTEFSRGQFYLQLIHWEIHHTYLPLRKQLI